MKELNVRGAWLQGLKHGYGEISWPESVDRRNLIFQLDGIQKVGDSPSKKKNFSLENSKGYKGEWFEDQINGQGTWTLFDGTAVEGIWENIRSEGGEATE